MTEAQISLSLPIAWIARLHQISEAQGMTVTTLLEETIAQSFNLRETGQGEALARIEQRLLQMEQRLQRVELLRTFPTPPAPPIASGPAMAEEEDWTDEPDEILYDFLPPEER